MESQGKKKKNGVPDLTASLGMGGCVLVVRRLPPLTWKSCSFLFFFIDDEHHASRAGCSEWRLQFRQYLAGRRASTECKEDDIYTVLQILLFLPQKAAFFIFI